MNRVRCAIEEHFVACPECTEQLELARGFQRGLKSMVAEDAVIARTAVQLGLFAWLAVFFKKAGKLIIVAFVAVIAFFKKMFAKLFGRKTQAGPGS